MAVGGAKDATLRPSSHASHGESATSTLAKSVPQSLNEKEPTSTKTTKITPKMESKKNPAKAKHEIDIVEPHSLKDQVQNAVQEAKIQDSAVNEQEDNTVYPAGWKLGLITIALCLSVFCMALVCPASIVTTTLLPDHFAGQYYHRGGRSQDHRSLQRA